MPGGYEIQVTFRGTRSLRASLDSAPFVVGKRDTVLLLEPVNVPGATADDTKIIATLKESDLGADEAGRSADRVPGRGVNPAQRARPRE